MLKRNHAQLSRLLTGLAVVASLACLESSQRLGAQQSIGSRPPTHYRHQADMYPGRIGRDALARGAALHGYFQPVEVVAPDSAQVAVLRRHRREEQAKRGARAEAEGPDQAAADENDRRRAPANELGRTGSMRHRSGGRRGYALYRLLDDRKIDQRGHDAEEDG